MGIRSAEPPGSSEVPYRADLLWVLWPKDVHRKMVCMRRGRLSGVQGLCNLGSEKAGVLNFFGTCELSQGIKRAQGRRRWRWRQFIVLDQLLRLLSEPGCFHLRLFQKSP